MTEHKCDECDSMDATEYVNQWTRGDKDEAGNELDGIEWLCDEHAIEAGFCLGCHYFCAGMESYDFSPIKGYCGDCVEELRYEAGEYDGDDDEFYGDDFDYEELP